MFILLFLAIIYIFVNFYVQSDQYKTYQFKKFETLKDFIKSKIFTVLLYIILSLSTFIFLVPNQFLGYIIFFGVLISYGLIDFITVKWHNRSNDKTRPYIFVVSQATHLIVITLISFYIVIHFSPTLIGNFVLSHESFLIFTQYLLALLLVGKTGNVFFKELLGKYKPTEEDEKEAEKKHYTVTSNSKAGGLIGILERILLMISLIAGSYATIGLILAAKSVARFKSLEITKFGEYFLIGTMFSILYATFVYYLLFILI